MLRKNRIFIAIATVIVLFGIYIFKSSCKDLGLQYSQEYIAGTRNIKGNVDTKYFTDISLDFEIGANRDGYAVFKNPDAAFARLISDYKAGIDLIQREYGLSPLSETDYELYKAYGWQVTTGTEQEKKQASFISGFMDIYENSYQNQ